MARRRAARQVAAPVQPAAEEALLAPALAVMVVVAVVAVVAGHSLPLLRALARAAAPLRQVVLPLGWERPGLGQRPVQAPTQRLLPDAGSRQGTRLLAPLPLPAVRWSGWSLGAQAV